MLRRLPSSRAILQVYAVIAVMFSWWTITAFLWKLSAWLLILNIGEIITVFSYSIAANVIEGLSVLLLLLILCALLPASLLRDDFVVRGTILAVGLIGALMAFVRLDMQFGIESGNTLWIGPLAVLLLTTLLLILQPKLRLVHSAVLWISDRMTVFLYILLPAYIVLSVYILFRSFR